MNQNFCSVLLKQSCFNLHKFLHNSGAHLGSHYETLKLQRNCTSKEIRDSFIKLSKQNHPDVNKDPKAHKEFLKIQDAYNTLSKSASRATYDLSLSKPYHSNEDNTTHVRSTRPGRYEEYGEGGRDPWNDPYFYHNRARSRAHHGQNPYYGIRGVNKVSNGVVAFIVILFAFSAFFGQMIVINYSFALQREKMVRKSQETQAILNEVRDRANRNGNDIQIEIMRKHFEEADRRREELRERME